MSDHYNGFFVILKHDTKDDEAQATINAIKQIRGVIDVQPHIADPDVAIAKAQLRAELFQELFEVLQAKLLKTRSGAFPSPSGRG